MGRCFSTYASEVHFTKKEIDDFVHLEHPIQEHVAKTMGVDKYESVPNLPAPYMLGMDSATLYYDEGLGKYGKGYGIASLILSHNDPWFWSHFPADPVMPGSQGVDTIMQLAGLWAGCTAQVTGRPRALEGRFIYKGQVLPNCNKVYYRIDVQRFLKKKKILFFDGELCVDTPDNRIYTFSEGKLAFYSHEELCISPKRRDFYNPNWQQIRADLGHWIDRMEGFYLKWRSK